METFSALLAICAGNSPVTSEFPSQRLAARSFDVFFDLCLNKWLSKQSLGWLFETPSRALWRHDHGYDISKKKITEYWFIGHHLWTLASSMMTRCTIKANQVLMTYWLKIHPKLNQGNEIGIDVIERRLLSSYAIITWKIPAGRCVSER